MTFQSKVVLCRCIYAAEGVVLLHARPALSNLEPIDFNIIKTCFSSKDFISNQDITKAIILGLQK